MRKYAKIHSLFWTATSLGILNYDTPFYQYVRSGHVTVHRRDICELTESTINFTDGTKIEVDALSQVTGQNFAPVFSFKPAGIDGEIGVPSLRYTSDQEKFWNNLDVKADAKIFARFPILKKAPRQNDQISLDVDATDAETFTMKTEATNQNATKKPPQQ